MLILAAAVAHAIPTGCLRDHQTIDSTGQVIAAKTDPSWFCRVTLEIVHATRTRPGCHGLLARGVGLMLPLELRWLPWLQGMCGATTHLQQPRQTNFPP